MRLLLFHLLLLLSALALVQCRSSASLKRAAGPESSAAYPLPDFWTARGPRTPTLVSAHRAHPELRGIPENSLAGIEYLLRAGDFVLELDVAMSRDSVLFLFHDEHLDRLTRNGGRARDATWARLDTMRLLDRSGQLTQHTIPTLTEALEAARGRALLTLDRKGDVPLQLIDAYVRRAGSRNEVAYILYDENDYLEWARLDSLGPVSYSANSPEAIDEYAQRSVELYSHHGLRAYRKREALPTLLFLGVGEPDRELLARAQSLELPTIVGTFGYLDSLARADGGQTYRDLRTRGIDFIATDRPLAAHRALRN